MGRNFWLSVTAVFAGVAALASLIWYVAPLLGLFGIYPFENNWVRAASIVFVALGGIGYIVHSYLSRRNAQRELGSAVMQDEGDAAELKERMKGALAKLKASSGAKGDALYDLPWYVIIGSPGSGKTTALVNSGMKFPLAGDQTPAAVAGIGGTRYCDWWFTEEAVLIDTAGRYTTQDSSKTADSRSWLAFLDLLKKNRPRQPINGVIVAVSMADLVSLNETELDAHAMAVRSRLHELHEHLKINFPVYVLFTKMDLIAGFTEFFGTFGEMQRRMVWGATFQDPGKTENLVARSPEEFDALVERLGQFLTDRLQNENDPTGRLRIFGFPAQVATLKRPVLTFLNSVFEPTRYQSTATLRGFYFSSGTQQGTPIDRIIGSLSKSFGAEALGEGYLSGGGRSYFINDLLRKVVIGESAWVSTDRAAVRRSLGLRISAYALLALVVAGGVAAWTTSYAVNDRLIDDSEGRVADYRRSAGRELSEQEIRERRFETVLPLLDQMRGLPTGYATKDEPTPTSEGFGLSQRPHLTSAAETSYRGALERLLRPRLLFRLEEIIRTASRAQSADRTAVYEPFKTYLMLGGLGPIDKGLILDWARRDWAQDLYPGPEREGMRRSLESHITAMLDLDNGVAQTNLLDGDLIRNVQQSLLRLSLAERAYQIMRTTTSSTARDWILVRAPVDMEPVFTTTDGTRLDSIRVPGFYTYDGFYTQLLDRLPDIAGQLERERWVLGDVGRQAVVGDQFGTLADDILVLYAKDFIAAWTNALGKMKFKPLTADKPHYATLVALSAPASPLKQIFEEIKQQTDLSRPRPQGSGAAPAPTPAVVFSTSASAGRSIETNFRPFYLMADGQPGKRAIDEVVANLGEIYQGLIGIATEGGRPQQMTSATRQNVRDLRGMAGRFPPPFAALLRSAADEIEGNVASAVVADLQKSLAGSVTQTCRQLTSNRYPFAKSDNVVQPADFARVFGPNGIMDEFFNKELNDLVDRSKAVWVWKRDNKVSAMLSPGALRMFQYAADIKDTFFSAGPSGFAYSVTPLSAAQVGTGTTLVLEINGVQASFPPSPPPVTDPSATPPGRSPSPAPPPPPPPTPTSRPGAPVTMNWPGPPGAGSLAFLARSDQGVSFPVSDRPGAWAIFRLVDQSRMARQGQGYLVSTTVNGRDVRFLITLTTQQNPFKLEALTEFKCPTTLQ